MHKDWSAPVDKSRGRTWLTIGPLWAVLGGCGAPVGSIAVVNNHQNCALAARLDGGDIIPIAAGASHRFEDVKTGEHTLTMTTPTTGCQVRTISPTFGSVGIEADFNGCDITVTQDETATTLAAPQSGEPTKVMVSCP